MPASSAPPKTRAYTVAVDTREQLPYEWPEHPYQLATLATGDYSVVGLEDQIAIERKSLNDYWGCMGKQRFRDCLERLSRIRYRCVVIEADASKVLAHTYLHFTPSRHGNCRQSLITGRIALSITREHLVHFGVPIWFANDREQAQEFTGKFLEEAWRRINVERKRKTLAMVTAP